MQADYVIVGGGLSGCVVASRLSQSASKPAVILIEAGALPDGHPLIGPPLACFATHHTELDWDYTTVPQQYLNDRRCYAAAAKVLSGGTAINYGSWTLGSKADYDEWARVVDDDRFKYNNFSRYIEKGLIKSGKISSTRVYPLRERTKETLEKEMGLHFNPTSNSGVVLGFEEYCENFNDGKRQLASVEYDLSKVKVMHSTHVTKVLLEMDSKGTEVAVGVQTQEYQDILATKEVILAAGVYRTPHILLHSGIGPNNLLREHGIKVKRANESVGENLHDHLCTSLWWKLRDPSDNYVSQIESHPEYSKGLCADWIAWQRCPDKELQQALSRDGYDIRADLKALLHPQRSHVEMLATYTGAGAAQTKATVPRDGSVIGQLIFLTSPTSRGSVTISSDDPQDGPVIDPNYYSTEADRIMLRNAVRTYHQAFSKAKYVQAEFLAPEMGEEVVKHGLTVSDDDIDSRIKLFGSTIFHPGGTCSMGTVVDSQFRVKDNIQSLRIVDASVVPIPLAAHSQVCMYALAEMAAEMITEGA